MYKSQVIYNVNDMQDRINSALKIINDEHGIISSTSSNKYHTFIFYEVPSEGI